MQALIFVAALVVAGIGQWFNAHPSVPTWVSKLAMAGIGLAFYAVVEGPHGWHGQPLLDWLDRAWLWAAALPGIASLIGLAPQLKTSK